MLPPLVPIIDGNDAGETLVFIQGWPDDASLWDSAVAAVRGSYRCVRLTLPNFGGDRTARWGYSTEEIIGALVDFVRQAGRGRRVTLVLHDWGSYWGHAVHHRAPELVARVATVDVALCPEIGANTGSQAVGAACSAAVQWVGVHLFLSNPVFRSGVNTSSMTWRLMSRIGTSVD